ncbi:hypothetical protein Tco_0492683 [Tanacetum coccineum]
MVDDLKGRHECINGEEEKYHREITLLADPGIPDGQAVQTTILNNASFQSEDLDAYDSDCDDVSNAKAVLMADYQNSIILIHIN